MIPKKSLKAYLLTAIVTVSCTILSCPTTRGDQPTSKYSSSITTDRPIIIVVFGHPGAGKGTFAQSLKDKKFTHLSIGDFLRNEFNNQTSIGLRWKAEIQTFGILAVGVIKEVTGELIKRINSSLPLVYILDGHVRTLEQAKHLDDLLSINKKIDPIFIYINTNKNEAFKRILERRTCNECYYIYNLTSLPSTKGIGCQYCKGLLTQRNTDNEINAQNRIDTYAPYLEETIEYYKSKNKLIEINGNLCIHEYMLKCRELFD